jgi:hypothetical protein
MGRLRHSRRRVDLQIHGEVLISLANATGRAERRLRATSRRAAWKSACGSPNAREHST